MDPKYGYLQTMGRIQMKKSLPRIEGLNLKTPTPNILPILALPILASTIIESELPVFSEAFSSTFCGGCSFFVARANEAITSKRITQERIRQ